MSSSKPFQRPRRGPAAFLLAAGVALSCVACSAQALKRTGYETLHNISDIRNEDDPKYVPDRGRSFEDYQRQREESLRGGTPQDDVPILPAPPPVP